MSPTISRIQLTARRLLTVVLIATAAVCLVPEYGYAKKTTTKAKTTTTKKSTASKKKSSTPARTTSDVRKEKERTEKEIAETRKKLSDNEKRTRDQLDRLNSINSQIERQESTIADLTNTISNIEGRSAVLRDSINDILTDDSLLRADVARSLRSQHVQRTQMSPLVFILSASTFNEGQRRLHYINQMSRARNRKITLLRDTRNLLDARRAALDSMADRHNSALKQLATANSVLDSRRRESNRVVADLKKEGASLNKVLADKRRKAQQLDNELNRIIAEEQRRQQAEEAARRKKQQQSAAKPSSKPSQQTSSKPSGTQGEADADRTLTGSFVSNKGKLLFPVAGRYTIVGSFGRSRHGDLDHVQVDNSGIDISVNPGTTARAVFDGTVSSIFFMDGYENIVIIRHGEYLTVYAGLANIRVAKGDKVKGGTTLGTIATIDSRTVLHFEVRKERSKLNPMDWVK